jgi:hypothetical protein
MSPERVNLLDDLIAYTESCGIRVRRRNMDLEKPGEFDGPTITINPKHDREALAFYMAHALGSIYQWSTDFEHSKKVFDGLRDAKKQPPIDEALERWRRFEATSSDHAVWALGHLRYQDAVRPYTVFFRADIEAMTIFHRTGKEPRWPDFFADWKEKVGRGEIQIEPFQPRPIGPFTPVTIEKQEVLQERD